MKVPFGVTTFDLTDFFSSSNLICKACVSDLQVHNLDRGLRTVFLREFIELLPFKWKAKAQILLQRGPELILDQQVKDLAKIHIVHGKSVGKDEAGVSEGGWGSSTIWFRWSTCDVQLRTVFDTNPPERQGQPRRQSCNSADHTTAWPVTLTDCHRLCHCHSSFLGRTDKAVMDISHAQGGILIPQKNILFSIKSLFWPSDFLAKEFLSPL